MPPRVLPTITHTPKIPKMGRSIAITGGAGFVGLALAEALLARGDRVYLLDIAPPDPTLFARPELSGTRYVRGDIMDTSGLRAALHECDADLVIHSAAMTPNAQSAKAHPAQITQINVVGAINTLTAAANAGLSDVILLSSISVYGSRGTGAPSLLENARVTPDSLYGETKHAAERLAARIAPDLGLRLATLRLGPLFGPWETGRPARPDLSPHAQILHLSQSGQSVRLAHEMLSDWVYSRDAASMIAGVTEHMEQATGRCFNIGAGQKFTLIDWTQAMGLPSPIIDPQAPDIAPRSDPSRAPLSVAAIGALTGIYGSRTMQDAVKDELSWRATLPPLSKDFAP